MAPLIYITIFKQRNLLNNYTKNAQIQTTTIKYKNIIFLNRNKRLFIYFVIWSYCSVIVAQLFFSWLLYLFIKLINIKCNMNGLNLLDSLFHRQIDVSFQKTTTTLLNPAIKTFSQIQPTRLHSTPDSANLMYSPRPV